MEFVGNKDLLNKKIVGIVGSRDAKKQAIRETFTLAKMLVKCGYVVCSGLASGIDTSAHLGGIKSTIAVMPVCCLTSCYPYSNIELKRKIIENNGLLISISKHDTPVKQDFFNRNDVVVDLCDFLIVMDGKIPSGTFYTTKRAILKGKKVIFFDKIFEASIHKYMKQSHFTGLFTT